MNLKNFNALLILAFVTACQSNVPLDKPTVFDANSAAIAVTRPQNSNDFPVAYSALATDSQQRAKVVNRLELVVPQPEPKGWFDKLKNFIGI